MLKLARLSGPRTGAAGASAGVFSSPPRRARLNLTRTPLSAGGVWGLRVWVCGRTLENRPWSPPLLPAIATLAAAVLPPTNAMWVQENPRLAHGPSRGSFCFLVIQVPKYTMGALSIIGAKNGAQQASAVLSWGSVLWCGAMAIAHHTHHGQVRACVMAHTTHTPSYTPHWGWGRGSVVWRARATRATPPCEPGVGG